MNSKTLKTSKTFWVNAIVFIVALLTFAANQDFVKQYPDIATFIIAIIPVINVVLRFFTKMPLTWFK